MVAILNLKPAFKIWVDTSRLRISVAWRSNRTFWEPFREKLTRRGLYPSCLRASPLNAKWGWGGFSIWLGSDKLWASPLITDWVVTLRSNHHLHLPNREDEEDGFGTIPAMRCNVQILPPIKTTRKFVFAKRNSLKKTGDKVTAINPLVQELVVSHAFPPCLPSPLLVT